MKCTFYVRFACVKRGGIGTAFFVRFFLPSEFLTKTNKQENVRFLWINVRFMCVKRVLFISVFNVRFYVR